MLLLELISSAAVYQRNEWLGIIKHRTDGFFIAYPSDRFGKQTGHRKLSDFFAVCGFAVKWDGVRYD